MSDHLPAKLFPMIDHLTVKPFPMIDHRKQFEIHLSDHLTAKTMSTAELPPTVMLACMASQYDKNIKSAK